MHGPTSVGAARRATAASDAGRTIAARYRERTARWRRRWRGSRLARRLVRRRVAAALAALCVGVVVHGLVTDATELRRSWGDTVPALVATRAMEAGERLDEHTTKVVDLPAALVPEGALGALPARRRVGAAVARGEVLSEARFAPGGVGATAAGLAGAAAVTVPNGDAAAPVRRGDLVDVYRAGTWDPYAGGGADSSGATASVSKVASSARVLHTTATAVTLDLGSHEVEAVLAALAVGPPQLVIVG